MRIAVIGGGPAGMIAAGFAGSRGKDVTLIEKNKRLGKKLFITGKGRCNITNASPIEDFFNNIITNSQFLYSGFYSFTNEDIIRLLESYGLKVKVERGNRVFPASDKSSDVLKTLSKFLLDNNVKIILNRTVIDIEKVVDGFNIKFKDNSIEKFDKIIIATGGKSYPATGSTGDGYNFAAKLGHHIEKLKPSLVPIETKEIWIKNVQGLSLKNVKLISTIENENIHEEFGEMIFTHYGISGPIVLSMSNIINKHIRKNIKLFIDLKPALSKEKLDKRILRDFLKFNNKHLKNGLDELLPQKLIPIVIDIASIDGNKPIHQITKEERQSIVETIKKLPLTFKGFRPLKEAIVTSGGVSTGEIDPSTMESKLIPNLFFCGEVLDVDGLTGGYNLQIAYSTGYLAGINI
ncbi:NAD(P)/FAD-dependent oxidoreductase [Schnuerera sp.]|uniref:NAD(P)/FAD-dependent oxidoreductase n=1 Tax=Schnuerera sp. TaxID=2794844 RepID=UPI002C35A491|nr:NAD(P)/FAD-dependent oxidoreductase [Schnuerera sp.]HSH35132.1 NAD(P)/FAD-dependent oxidoreductase [Schnuerera sp.]